MPDDPWPRAWERLIVAGKERGYLTVGEIDAVFTAVAVRPPGDLEPAFQLLRSLGIDIQP